ncbi:MAG TPA: CopD family protein [Longimicrobiales bacterium]|nr:CopD family protein [Longimicrobiales bacterium]
MTTSYFSVVEWPDVPKNLYEFVGIFCAIGAVGFRYSSLRGRVGGIYDRIAKRAAAVGFIGAILTLIHVFEALPRLAQRAKMPVSEFMQTPSPGAAWLYFTILAVIGYALALAGKRIGWHVAAFGVIGGLLRNLGQVPIGRMTTPMHVLTGGLWIGTLFVLVVAGLSVLAKGGGEVDELGDRGVIVADMVNAFSPLALTCGLLVLVFGVIAAFREIRPISGLWTTQYGYTLIAKVCVVMVVLALGAWNWKKQRPTLGTEAAAQSLRRTATKELIAAALVIILTSVMLSLPEPH